MPHNSPLWVWWFNSLVHAALNHMDESMKVTDIYIERDFAIENNANAKVIDYVFNR